MTKKSFSTLTSASLKKFSKLLDMDDLYLLTDLSGKATAGKITIEKYQEEEKKMIEKYGLLIKK